MAGKRMFLAGLVAGAIGGFVVGRRADRSRRVPHLDLGQQVLAETRGEVKAALLAARAQARYDELYAQRPRFRHPALRRHLEGGVLPALALYQTLCQESGDREAALADMDRIVAALVEQSGRRRMVRALERLPDPFAVLRIANRWAMVHVYPPAGWRFEWVEDSDRRIAYDARECFYVNLFTAYGAPELAAHLCVVDDLLFGDFPGVSWKRTQMLSRGDERCDFRFCRTAVVDDASQ